MGEAYVALDKHCWDAVNQPDTCAPDTAHDWIFMMHADDWSLLRAAWPQRPSRWREECAYILGQGPFQECVRLLELALFDLDPSVAIQAGVSYSAQLLEQAPPLLPEPGVRARLHDLVATATSQNVKEIRDLLALQ